MCSKNNAGSNSRAQLYLVLNVNSDLQLASWTHDGSASPYGLSLSLRAGIAHLDFVGLKIKII